MIITINSVTLCAGYASNEHVFDFSSEVMRLIQESKPIGASAGKTIDRGNLMSVFEFSVEKISNSLVDAEVLIISHAATAMTTSGTCTLVAEPAGTGHTGTLSDANVEDCKLVAWNGVATVWRYRLRGGVLTVT